MKIAGISSKKLGDVNEGQLNNKNLYNDKELFDDADLNWYDYGFRNYDPQIGRFTQLDPLTDDYPYLTPYQYASCEPIANVDVDGLEGVSVIIGVASYTAVNLVNIANVASIGIHLGQLALDLSNSHAGEPEWASKAGFFVHQTANDVAMQKIYMKATGLNRTPIQDDKETAKYAPWKAKSKAMNAGTVWADSKPNQTAARAYMHAMSNKDINESPVDAKKAADLYVRQMFTKARKFQAEGNIYMAYFFFGAGLHALQDATSPAHAGFQPWSDHESRPDEAIHVNQEMKYPGGNSNLQKITDKYLNWFENTNDPLPNNNLFDDITPDPVNRLIPPITFPKRANS